MAAEPPPLPSVLDDPAFADAVLDAAPVIVVVLTVDGRVIHYNRFMERLCGRPLAEVRGRDWFVEFLPADERHTTRAVLERSIREGETQGYVNPIVTAGGELRTIEWWNRKLVTHAGSPAIVAVGVDISDRLREAEDRADLAQRFALFANRVDEAFFMTNATRDRILYLSPAWERIVGIPCALVYADPSRIGDYVHPEDKPKFYAALGAPAPAGDGGQVEHEYRMSVPIPGRPGEFEDRWLAIRQAEVQLRDDQAPRVVGTITDISERKRAQAEIAELGRIFTLFDEAVDEVWFLLSPKRDRVLHASGSIERLFGFTREAVYADIGVLFERVHPDDRAWLAATIGETVPSAGLSYEYRVLRRDGAVRWMVSRLRVLGPDSGMPGAVVSISMDITERHEAELALRKLTEELESRVRERTRSLVAERERLQQILDGMAVHVALLDAHGRVLTLNAKAGGSALAPALIGRSVAQLPGLRYAETSVAAMAAALVEAQAGETARFDLELESSIGCDSIVDTTLSPILAGTGEVAEIVATAIDVTERRATERRLRDAVAELERKEARLADAQRIAKVGDWDWDIPSGELLWSEQVYRIFGVDPGPSEVSYAAFLAHVHPDDREAVVAAVDRAVTADDRYAIEHRIVRPDGEVRQVLEQGEVTRAPDGAAVRMQGTVQDITERIQVEAQLRASLREKDALLHEIHHRVKNNLQVVASLLYLQGVNAEPSVREVLDECRARIRSMALIHEHLYLSGQLASVDMREFLAKLGDELLRVFADGRRLTIRVAGGGLELEIERAVPVALIVTELLTNALKYAYPDLEPDPRTSAEIRVTLSPTTIEIADDGVGLPEDLDRPMASSLGLRLVHVLARQLDAQLDFERGSGTTVRLGLREPPQA